MICRRRSYCLVVTLLLLVVSMAADRSSRLASEAETVELFAAMEAGQVDVSLIPRDAKQATVIVKNTTDRPLHIRMPEAFAGVPVLAQGDLGDAGFGNSGNNNNNMNQSFGGGFGGGGLGGGGLGGFGGGGGFFNVAPDRVGKLKVATVCLEHGKKDPNPRVAYRLKKLDEFTDKPELIEVCRMLGRQEIDQSSAQAAAWHLADHLSWVELSRKVRVRHLNGRVELYFSPQQIRRALRIVYEVAQRTQRDTTSPGERESES